MKILRFTAKKLLPLFLTPLLSGVKCWTGVSCGGLLPACLPVHLSSRRFGYACCRFVYYGIAKRSRILLSFPGINQNIGAEIEVLAEPFSKRRRSNRPTWRCDRPLFFVLLGFSREKLSWERNYCGGHDFAQRGKNHYRFSLFYFLFRE